MIRIDPRDSEDLVPGRADFVFGVLFRKDAVSSGSEVNNGDNLVQRGTFDQPAQYKVQVDRGQPSCLIRGADGELLAKAKMRVSPEVWYLAICGRVGESIRLTVTEFGIDGELRPIDVVATGPIGTVIWPGTPPPLSVGGKLSIDGELLGKNSDQFNGSLDLPFVAVSAGDN